MAEFKPYVAIQPFVLNLDNGKVEVRVSKGDIVEYDGSLMARCKDYTGQARGVGVVIRAGEWLRPIAPENIPVLQARLAGKIMPPVSQAGPDKARNMTVGKIVENSDPSVTRAPRKEAVLDQDLTDLIGKYEKEATAPAKPLMESSHPLPHNRVIRDDDNIVATVKNDKIAAENSAGVIMGKQESSTSTVISHEERVVKETGKKAAVAKPVQKKMTIIRDSDERVVKKTGPIQKAKTTVTPGKAVVSNEERVVKNTSYVNDTHTDVGSSTQVSVEMNRKVTAEDLQQDAKVVKKVNPVKVVPDETAEGIIMNNFVGASRDEDMGEATVSSGNQDVDMGEVTLGSGGTPIMDLAEVGDGGDDSGVSVVPSENDDISGMDIDISDLIQ